MWTIWQRGSNWEAVRSLHGSGWRPGKGSGGWSEGDRAVGMSPGPPHWMPRQEPGALGWLVSAPWDSQVKCYPVCRTAIGLFRSVPNTVSPNNQFWVGLRLGVITRSAAGLPNQPQCPCIPTQMANQTHHAKKRSCSSFVLCHYFYSNINSLLKAYQGSYIFVIRIKVDFNLKLRRSHRCKKKGNAKLFPQPYL